VSYDTPPRNVIALNQRLKNLEGDDILAARRRTTTALVVIGQMLPEGAVKGGSAMALRYGSNTRFTLDLDAARAQALATFRAEFEKRLREGWGSFTGRLVERTPPEARGDSRLVCNKAIRCEARLRRQTVVHSAIRARS
jgi:hypothetical protein